MAAADNLARILCTEMSSIPQPFNSGTPLVAGTKYAQVLTSYLIANTTLLGSYSGVIPGTPPVPEIIPSDIVTISGSLTPVITGNFDQWIKSIETGIKTLFMVGVGVTHPLGTFTAFPTLSINLTQSKMKSHFQSFLDKDGQLLSGVDIQFECHKLIASSIIDAMKIGFIPTYAAGLAGTGVFTVSSVSIK